MKPMSDTRQPPPTDPHTSAEIEGWALEMRYGSYRVVNGETERTHYEQAYEGSLTQDEAEAMFRRAYAALRQAAAPSLTVEQVAHLNGVTAQLDAERRRWYTSLEQAYGLPANALEGLAPEVAASKLAALRSSAPAHDQELLADAVQEYLAYLHGDDPLDGNFRILKAHIVTLACKAFPPVIHRDTSPLPHLCQDGHEPIRWRGDGEMCPVCVASAPAPELAEAVQKYLAYLYSNDPLDENFRILKGNIVTLACKTFPPASKGGPQ